MAPKRAIEKPLSGKVFAITGTLTVPRAKFEAFICQNGGSIVKSVTNTCTHLVSAETGTKKCQDAEEKGVVIVDEDWVRNTVENGEPSAATAVPALGVNITACAPTSVNTVSQSAAPIPIQAKAYGKVANLSKPLEGMTICITGTLSVPRAEFERLITAKGGKNVKSVNSACTHLVVASMEERETKKCQDAEAKGVEIIDEDGIRVLMGETVSDVTAAPTSINTVSQSAVPIPVQAKAYGKVANLSKPLEGMTICITGTLSVPRAEFERLITAKGGKNVKSVNSACTHLVVASMEERETKKCQDAEAKGVEIIDEDGIRELMGEAVNRGPAVVTEGDLQPQKAFKPVNQDFRSDRATIHLYSAEEDEEGDGEEEATISNADLKKLKPFLRRGDVLENVSESGYRSSGVRMYDGKKVVDLCYDYDDYGTVGPEFVVYREFNPCYWDYSSMNVNNMLVPDVDGSQSGWHSGDFPGCFVDRKAILEADGKQITMFGKVYNVPQELKDWVVEHADDPEAVLDEGMRYVEDMEEEAFIVLV